MMDEPGAVRISAGRSAEATTLTIAGKLDSSTYLSIRDAVIKAALDEPAAVVVDVSALQAPATSAWSVFTSARWLVSTWPDVPILLVCADSARRETIRQGGVARYVPVVADRAAAYALIGDRPALRRRARAELPAASSSVARAREIVANWLHTWAIPELAPAAGTVATVLVENVLVHTTCAPVVILESLGDHVTVAVSDLDGRPALRHEDAAHGTRPVSGLAFVAALSRSWGSTPNGGGKTVWAVLGPESRL